MFISLTSPEDTQSEFCFPCFPNLSVLLAENVSFVTQLDSLGICLELGHYVIRIGTHCMASVRSWSMIRKLLSLWLWNWEKSTNWGLWNHAFKLITMVSCAICQPAKLYWNVVDTLGFLVLNVPSFAYLETGREMDTPEHCNIHSSLQGSITSNYCFRVSSWCCSLSGGVSWDSLVFLTRYSYPF